MWRGVCVSERGNRANEDFACVGDGYGVLLDGATGLAGDCLFPGEFQTNAQWLSHRVGAMLCASLGQGLGLPDALAVAVTEARDEFEAALGCPLDEADPDVVPSATLAVVTVRDGVVDVWGLGDSPTLVLLRDGRWLVGTDDALEAMDGRVVALATERLAARRAAGDELAGRDRRGLVTDELLANRRLRNATGGYWCLDPTGAALGHLRHLRAPVERVLLAGAMSDGLWRAFGLLGIARLDDLRQMGAADLRLLVDRMRCAEESDPDFERYGRLKLSDDASAFLLGPSGSDEGATGSGSTSSTPSA